MEYKYLILEDYNGKTSLQRAKGISKELHSLSRPRNVRDVNDVSNYMFGWIKHPTQELYALEVIMDYDILVHPSNNLSDLIALLDNVTLAEIQTLSGYINANANAKIPFQSIIPSSSNVKTKEQMVGWFPTVDEMGAILNDSNVAKSSEGEISKEEEVISSDGRKISLFQRIINYVKGIFKKIF